MYPISYLRTNTSISQGGVKPYIELYIAIHTPLANTKEKDIPVPSSAINDYEPAAIENDRVEQKTNEIISFVLPAPSFAQDTAPVVNVGYCLIS